MKKAYYWISAVILLVMAWCLWKQFSTVMIYYDDYGYYSLTYGAVGHRGDIYSLSELISFLKTIICMRMDVFYIFSYGCSCMNSGN